MSDDETKDAAPAAGGTARFAGLKAFQDAVRAMLGQAASEGWTELILSDPDFSDWPLGERNTMALLNEWAGFGRHLTMLAGSYDEILRRHARFVVWRKTWSHIIECRQSGGGDPRSTPSAIWSQGHLLHRFDLENCAGLQTREPVRCIQLRHELNDWIALSAPAFPASKLGL
jgi:hypothetical protein